MKASPHTEVDEELLDVRQLRMFELIYDTRSVTRAADQLGQKQPTVSIWLAKMRRQLADPLFVRTSDGMQPTPRAEALIVAARSALKSLRELTAAHQMFSPATTSRQFRICMADSSHLCLMPQLLADVRDAAPGVRLVAAPIDNQTARALESGEADLAIGFVPWLESGFYQQMLFPQDWVCLVNAVHPRVDAVLSLEAYKAENHVAVTGGTGARLLEETMAHQGIRRHVVLELPGFLGLSGIVAATDLIATLPRQIGETLARLAGVKVMECPLGVPAVDIKQHWHARCHQDPGSRWLRGLVAKAFMR